MNLSSETIEKIYKDILESIEILDDNTDKQEFFIKEFEGAYIFEWNVINYKTPKRLFFEWMSGMPSCIDVPVDYREIEIYCKHFNIEVNEDMEIWPQFINTIYDILTLKGFDFSKEFCKINKRLRSVNVQFENSNYNYSISVSSNSNDTDLKSYFEGKIFNMGHLDGDLQKCKSIIVE